MGRAVGVAKEAKVVAVRVLNCQGSGTVSNVVAGLNWVAQNAVLPAIVTMSLVTPAQPWTKQLQHKQTRVAIAAKANKVSNCSIGKRGWGFLQAINLGTN